MPASSPWYTHRERLESDPRDKEPAAGSIELIAPHRAGCSGFAQATNGNIPSSASAPKPYDLEMLLNVQETLSTSAQCTGFFVSYSIGGLSPQLGVISASGTHCATPDAAGNITVPATKLTLSSGSGDELQLTYMFRLTPTQAAPVYYLWSTFEITGGKGKYAGAQGIGVVHVLDRVRPAQGMAGLGILSAKGAFSY